MHEDYFLSCKVFAMVAWAIVGALLTASWLVMLFDADEWQLPVMLIGSACVSSAVAAVLHIRSYVVRLCAVIRASGRGEGEMPAARSLQSIR